MTVFPRDAFKIQNLKSDLQDAAYHFDAIVRYNMDMKARYTRYPVEIGVDMQDHAYNEPTAITVFGFTGSKELRISVNQMRELGASAVIGNINDPGLSVAAGIVGASVAYQAGNQQTRAGATLDFLQRLKEGFVRFDVQTDLTLIRGLRIDSINTKVETSNETGLEFIVEMSQKFVNGEGSPEQATDSDLTNADSATIQSAPVLNRGRIALV